MVHEFKTCPEPFQAMWGGSKKADIRDLTDRGGVSAVQVGDTLRFREWHLDTGAYTGRELSAVVTHVQVGYGLPPTMVVMSIHVCHGLRNTHRVRNEVASRNHGFTMS